MSTSGCAGTYGFGSVNRDGSYGATNTSSESTLSRSSSRGLPIALIYSAHIPLGIRGEGAPDVGGAGHLKVPTPEGRGIRGDDVSGRSALAP